MRAGSGRSLWLTRDPEDGCANKYDIGLSDVQKCRGGFKEEGTEKHRL